MIPNKHVFSCSSRQEILNDQALSLVTCTLLATICDSRSPDVHLTWRHIVSFLLPRALWHAKQVWLIAYEILRLNIKIAISMCHSNCYTQYVPEILIRCSDSQFRCIYRLTYGDRDFYYPSSIKFFTDSALPRLWCRWQLPIVETLFIAVLIYRAYSNLMGLWN